MANHRVEPAANLRGTLQANCRRGSREWRGTGSVLDLASELAFTPLMAAPLRLGLTFLIGDKPPVVSHCIAKRLPKPGKEEKEN